MTSSSMHNYDLQLTIDRWAGPLLQFNHKLNLGYLFTPIHSWLITPYLKTKYKQQLQQSSLLESQTLINYVGLCLSMLLRIISTVAEVISLISLVLRSDYLQRYPDYIWQVKNLGILPNDDLIFLNNNEHAKTIANLLLKLHDHEIELHINPDKPHINPILTIIYLMDEPTAKQIINNITDKDITKATLASFIENIDTESSSYMDALLALEQNKKFAYFPNKHNKKLRNPLACQAVNALARQQLINRSTWINIVDGLCSNDPERAKILIDTCLAAPQATLSSMTREAKAIDNETDLLDLLYRRDLDYILYAYHLLTQILPPTDSMDKVDLRHDLLKIILLEPKEFYALIAVYDVIVNDEINQVNRNKLIDDMLEIAKLFEFHEQKPLARVGLLLKLYYKLECKEPNNKIKLAICNNIDTLWRGYYPLIKHLEASINTNASEQQDTGKRSIPSTMLKMWQEQNAASKHEHRQLQNSAQPPSHSTTIASVI